MKKIILFFATALLGLSAYAQTCPSTLNLSLVNGDDPSKVDVELQLINTSSYLVGFNIVIQNVDGGGSIQLNRIGNYWLYFNFEDYLDVILANLEVPEGQDITDINFYTNYFDVKAYWRNGLLQLKQELWVPSGLFYPVLEEPTAIGRFSLDMTACEDGLYEFRVDNTIAHCQAYFKFPQGYHVWNIDNPLVFTLVKDGNSVTQLQSIAATFAPVVSGISTIDGDKQVAGVRYYNIAGVESSEPWQGVNIRFTTYTDGSRHTDKIIR